VWGTWYFSLLPEAVNAQKNGQNNPLALVDDLRKEMEKARPDRTRVKNLALEASDQLAPTIAKLGKRGEPLALQALLARISHDEKPVRSAGWDGAAQVYLALAALYQAEGDLGQRRDPGIRTSLETMRGLLEFPHPPPLKYNSPDERDFPKKDQDFLATLKQIQKHLGE
jgi:hypothetical protein